MEEQRYRTRGSLSSKDTQAIMESWNPCNSAETTLSSGPWVLTGEFTEMYDYLTPNFKKRSSQGEVFFNPMFKRIKRVVATSFQGRTVENKTTHLCSGVPRRETYRSLLWEGPNYYSFAHAGGPVDYIAPPPVISDSDINDFIVEKSTEMLNDRARPEHDIWESVAEINKTASLLPGLFKSLKKVVPRGKKSDALRSIAELWLSYRYGIIPLLADIEGVLKGLQKTIGKVRKTTRAVGSLKASSVEVATKTFSSYGMVLRATSTDACTIRVMSLDEFDLSKAFNIGFSGKGLITLPWELTPYSFVIDWFTNIGDFLGAIVPAVGLTQLGSCMSIKREKDLQIDHLSDNGGTAYQLVQPANGSYYSYVGEYSRTSGTPKPGLIIRNNFKFQNLTRSLDALGLLIVQLKGR